MTASQIVVSSRIGNVVQIGCLFAGLAGAQSLEWIKPSVSSLPSIRCCAAMAYDGATHTTVMFGGGNGGIYPPVRYNDTWVFSSTSGWSQASPATSPSPRQGATAAYDPTTGTVVLFGGGNGVDPAFADTWLWDGVTWTQQFPPVSPPGTEFDTAGMAYDAATGTVVMFSGANVQTWVWDGRRKTWTQRFPRTSPPQSDATVAYDAAHGKVVAFGGTNASQGYLNQTWTWDGLTWTQQFPSASPSPRSLEMMAYDVNLGKLVLFGGTAGPPSALSDTWTWDGTTWTQIQTPFSPGGRWASSLTYDPFVKGLLLFGGELAGDPFTNQTWIFTQVK